MAKEEYFPHKELSYKIRGILFKVQNDLGTKMHEKHYQRAVSTLFDKQSIPYETEKPVKILYEEKDLGTVRLDLVVDGKIVLELKTTDRITAEHRKQLLRYLESTGLEVGYIVNFRVRPLQIMRVINSKRANSADGQGLTDNTDDQSSASSAAPSASAESAHRALKERLGEELEHDILLAPFTTFKIGGAARYFFVARTADDLVRAITAAHECAIPFFMFGGGSNILVSDKGFDGLAIMTQIKGVEWRIEENRALVTAGAGEIWDELVAQCVERNLAGIECLSGIPGTVGAAPVQNIGAYGQSVDTVIRSVEAIDSKDGARVTFDNAGCEFGYRASIFKKMKGRYIITQVTLELTPSGAPLIAYHDLTEYFRNPPSPSLNLREGDPSIPPLKVRGGRGSYEISPSLAEVRQAVIEIRARKGYVIMPEYESFKTAGSFFMNPIVSRDQFEKLQGMIQECPDPWYWTVEDEKVHNPPQSPLTLRGEEKVKVSAACLLQSAGFSKGYRRGEAGISPKHSLSLVNFGGASAHDIVALAEEIKKRVRDKFDIELKEEVQLVGF
ncbi:UDP-N-acetylmuramate dehydrogenase [Candidatus Uhrbacteria bacterium]|nr:UDP-N-acetylmuramate dehydrogenase [Candidatus Uhrbacteria bacterium]